MRNGIRGLALLVLLALVASGSASPDGETDKRSLKLPPCMASTETRTFRGGLERSSIIVFGEQPNILMGLYVFDPHGNCVAHDDPGDDLAVEWFPPRSQSYTYEVRNLGMAFTSLEMAIR